ncbi:MAG: peptidoglycan DD-metalloendopeptidase family protein [Propionibacteriaceae bacterium]
MATLGVLLLATAAPAAWADQDLPTPARWPVGGEQVVLDGFAPPAKAWGPGHRGIDLAAAEGDRVRAAAAGRVSFAARLAGRGVVVVQHGAVRTTYEPVRATVQVGDRVTAGAPLGVLEEGGHCDPTCLHLGLKRGEEYLDPLHLFAERGADPGPATVRLLPTAAREVAADRAAGRVVATGQGLRGDVSPGAHGLVPPVSGPVTSQFGTRRHPVTGVVKLHDGVDFGAACGTPLMAPADGTVRQAYFNPGYGNRVIIDHGTVDGRHLVTAVNHLSASSVAPGQRIRQGQVVGAVGTTGLSTGCHLHLMLWLDGQLLDPLTWF